MLLWSHFLKQIISGGKFSVGMETDGKLQFCVAPPDGSLCSVSPHVSDLQQC